MNLNVSKRRFLHVNGCNLKSPFFKLLSMPAGASSYFQYGSSRFQTRGSRIQVQKS